MLVLFVRVQRGLAAFFVLNIRRVDSTEQTNTAVSTIPGLVTRQTTTRSLSGLGPSEKNIYPSVQQNCVGIAPWVDPSAGVVIHPARIRSSTSRIIMACITLNKATINIKTVCVVRWCQDPRHGSRSMFSANIEHPDEVMATKQRVEQPTIDRRRRLAILPRLSSTVVRTDQHTGRGVT